jgi:hypothetical protein
MFETCALRSNTILDRDARICGQPAHLNRSAALRIVPFARPIQPNFASPTLTDAADWILEQSR